MSDHTLQDTPKMFFLLKYDIVFKSSYFPSTVIEWKKIDKKIEKSKNLKIQKKKKIYTATLKHNL